MNQALLKKDGQCQCGKTTFTVQAEPIVRVFCHCQICQAFKQEKYSDITFFLSKDVILHDKETVAFKKYKSPPAVERGKCVVCHQPAIEFFDLPLFPSLTIIPSENINSEAFLLEPLAHIFYHRKVDAINDSLPKYGGFLKSQMAFSYFLLSGLFRKFTHA